MATRLPVALFNYENGGRLAPGQYNFQKLQHAFDGVDEAPALILLNEAKEWELWGETALHGAVNALSQRLGRQYEGRAGVGVRGPTSMPALLYDPQVVRLDYWNGNAQPDKEHPDKQNVGHAHLWGNSAAKFQVVIRHLNPNNGDKRLHEVAEISGFAGASMPTLLGGDLNATASGPHIPEMDWSIADDELRLKKAVWDAPRNKWVADTRALDFLLGSWNEERRARDARKVGWYALAELAHAQGMPDERAFTPTVNRGIDKGGSMLIDWMIVNEAWKDGLVPDTYMVHVPPGDRREDFPSDHRLVTATLEL
jgi:hypothetical protein